MIVRYTVANARRGLGQTSDPVAPPAPTPEPTPVVPSGPKPRWVNEGGQDLTRTLLAAGTVAALAIAGIVFLK